MLHPTPFLAKSPRAAAPAARPTGTWQQPAQLTRGATTPTTLGGGGTPRNATSGAANSTMPRNATGGSTGATKLAAAASSSSSSPTGSAVGASSPRAPLTFTLRLVVHMKSFSSEDVLLNPKSVPGLRVGDLIEIFQPDATTATAQPTGAPAHAHMPTGQRAAHAHMAAQAKLQATQPAPVSTLDPNNALFIRVQSLEPVKANFDISISSGLAELFHLQARKDVLVRTLVEPSVAGLEFIEISFQNQYIGRSDNWRIKHALLGASVFSNQPIQVEGMKLRVDEILLNGKSTKSGVITPSTRFTFRSRSARLFFLIQLSEEQWDFADDGELYFEKVLGFLRILFTEWEKLKVSHAVSIIFFSRTNLEVDDEWKETNDRRRRRRELHQRMRGGLQKHGSEDDEEDDTTEEDEEDHPEEDDPLDAAQSPRTPQPNGGAAGAGGRRRRKSMSAAPSQPFQTDPVSGRAYRDHYMVVIDCEHDAKNWENLIKVLKKKFHKYHRLLKWGQTDRVTGLRGYPSTAADGNFLEAINSVVTVYDKHYLDRDLFKTGQNIVLFSAGIGMFVVDAKLARLTKQRMVDGGIGCDLICMTRPPLHSVPLFAYKGGATSTSGAGSATSGLHSRDSSAGSLASNASASSQSFSKDASRLSRAHTGPAAMHARRGSIGSSSNHRERTADAMMMMQLQGQSGVGVGVGVQQVIQEGSEEAEERPGATASDLAHSSPANSTVSASAESALSANSNSESTTVSPLHPPLVAAHGTPADQPLATVLLPPSSDLDASRINPSPSPTVSTVSPQSSSSLVSTSSSPPAATPAPSTIFMPGSDGGSGAGGVQFRLSTMSTDRELRRAESEGKAKESSTGSAAAAAASPQYTVPHWLSIYFYDYQDLYDTPFGSLKTSHRDDTSRNRNDEFVSLSSVKLFDFFDLSFFQSSPHACPPTRQPFYPTSNSSSLTGSGTSAKEIPPPLKAKWFDAYDATVFGPTTQAIGVIPAMQQQQQLQQSHFASAASDAYRPAVSPSTALTTGVATPVTSDSILTNSKSPNSANVGAGGGGSNLLVAPKSPNPTGLQATALRSSPSQLTLPASGAPTFNSSGGFSSDGAKRKTLSGGGSGPVSGGSATKKKPAGSLASSSSSDGGSGLVEPLTASASLARKSTTSGPNVLLQMHVQGAQTTKTVFQSRWGHLFGHLYATLDHLHNPLRPNWKSLCQPAVLPLTTDYWPSNTELLLNYFEYNHTLALVHNQNDYNNNTAALLEEITCQRQAQDYQHIVSDEIPPPKNAASQTVLYFSLRNQVHQITMDKRTNTIDVKRHVHKRVIQDLQLVKFPYAYFLWSPHANAFLPVHREIEPNRDEMKWSEADALLCDRYSAELTEEMKYRRNHYAIIPSAIPSGKFPSEYALFSSSRRFGGAATALREKLQDSWSRESEKRIQAFKAFMVFMFAERGDKIVQAATPPTAVTKEASAGSGGGAPPGGSTLPTPSPAVLAAQKEKAEKLAVAQAALQTAFTSFGVDIDLATAHRLPLPMPPVRSDAERAADEKELEDCLEQYENALGFAIADVRTRDIKIPLTKSPSAVSSASPTSPAVDESTRRYEWFQFEYDTIFHPHAVYHMEIKWLVATGMHLEAWIRNFIKKAETRFGLQIVKIPTNQPLRSADSFHVPVPLPVPNPHDLRLLEEYLLTDCGFVVDSELRGGCRQYVHESGMAAVRRLPSGLVWINNHLPSAMQTRKASVHLFIRIQQHAHRLAQMRAEVLRVVADVAALQTLKESF